MISNLLGMYLTQFLLLDKTMVLLLCLTHPAGDFLPFSGDGVFSNVGLVVALSISINSSALSEELHQHLFSPFLLHVLQ